MGKRILALLLAAVMCVGCMPEGMKQYIITFDGNKDAYEYETTRYRPGDKVVVYYTIIATDSDYSFYVDGEQVNPSYDEEKGYKIEFTMPDHDVEISHKERNTMEPDSGDDGMEEAEGDMTPVTIASLVIDDERYNIDKNVNYTAKQFFQSVGKESLEITLKENGGFEKCAELPWEFDTLYDKSCQVIGGDIVLYQGKTICLIYGENTADYTRIGRIETTVDEREALMKKLKKAKDVKVRFEVEYTE